MGIEKNILGVNASWNCNSALISGVNWISIRIGKIFHQLLISDTCVIISYERKIMKIFVKNWSLTKSRISRKTSWNFIYFFRKFKVLSLPSLSLHDSLVPSKLLKCNSIVRLDALYVTHRSWLDRTALSDVDLNKN